MVRPSRSFDHTPSLPDFNRMASHVLDAAQVAPQYTVATVLLRIVRDKIDSGSPNRGK